jgi:phosphoglycolate phosphatase
MINVVIFDLDGTIVNLPIDYKKLEKEIKKHTKTDDVKSILKTIASLDAEAKKEVFRVWDKLEAEAWKKATVNQNVIELFEKYHFERKALVTMQGEAIADEISKALNLRFNFIITREVSLDRFEQLVLAKEKLGVDFSRVLFVGNTEGDQKAAERANCQFLKV